MSDSPSGSVVIHCPRCHWNLGIALSDLEEVAAGVWGTIKCGRCGDRLNDLIVKEQEKIEAARGASASSLDQPMPMSGDGGTHTDIYR